MLELAPEIIIFDTEYTTWEGTMEREWGGPNEYKELVQIGAVLVETENFVEVGSFNIFVRPRKNPQLSEYFTDLTGISQEQIEREGVGFSAALQKFFEWCDGHDIYSWGGDKAVLEDNCRLTGVEFPFAHERFFDVRTIFKAAGIDIEQYESGTIVRAFGLEPTRRQHDGLNDARTIVDGLKVLKKRAVDSSGY